ncbi:MAG TPA: hypothetical protein DCQ58_04075 [Saprospirales bacterium]|nr:hypothetical protein [Saprospirales bacterium]
MSVIIEFAMFPTDKGESVSQQVSRVIDMIRQQPFHYQLTAMGTIIETEELSQALAIVQKAHDILAEDSNRIYASIKLDIRKDQVNRMEQKIQSIVSKIGSVNTDKQDNMQ